MNIKFRENWNRGTVDVYDGDLVVYSNREYRGSAIWAKSKYNLTDPQLMAIYRDYKDDYVSED